MPRKKTDVEKGLRRKGFVQQPGDHRYFVYETVDGKKTTTKTKTSHGSGGDLDDYLLGRMARQCGLCKQDFLSFVDCDITREEYERLSNQPT
jgi:hypothetical protein